MKKTICVISALIMIMSVGTACGKNNAESTTTTQTTTVPSFTEKNGVTNRRVNIDENTYEIDYLDENGNAVKTEHYVKEKLVYYYTLSDFDEFGNSSQQKYYDSKGKFLASYNKGELYDANGKKISEEAMNDILLNLQ